MNIKKSIPSHLNAQPDPILSLFPSSMSEIILNPKRNKPEPKQQDKPTPKPFIEVNTLDSTIKNSFVIHNCDWDGDGKSENAYIIWRTDELSDKNHAAKSQIKYFSSKNKQWQEAPIYNPKWPGDKAYETGIANVDIPVNGKYDGVTDKIEINHTGWTSGSTIYMFVAPMINTDSLKNKKTQTIDATGDGCADKLEKDDNNFTHLMPQTIGNQYIKTYNLAFNMGASRGAHTPIKVETEVEGK